MMSDNYPPGVSGFEYQIAGAEKEWEELRICASCGKEALFDMAAYAGEVWGTCPSCGETQDFESDAPDYATDVFGEAADELPLFEAEPPGWKDPS